MNRAAVCIILSMVISGVSWADLASQPNLGVKKLPPRLRLMSKAKEQNLRSQLPKVDDEEIQRLLEDPALILYSDAEIPPAYQDWSSGLPGVHSPRYNISANDSEPFGNGNVEFPWGAPGGTHRTTNVSTFRLLWLPAGEDGKRRPIVWYRKFLAGSRTQRGYAWTFPVGTVVGEVLRMRTPSGEYITFELRLRTREYGEWAVDVFRPFPTSDELLSRVKQLRPEWEQNKNLAKLVAHLEQPRELTQHLLAAHHPRAAFRESKGVDKLPAMGDDKLITELLTQTEFRSALGEIWRRGTNDVTVAAPTTDARYHIVPARYDAGFIEVDRNSCMDCHDTVNHHVNDFQFGRDWYGRIRGSDGIFSLHPFDPSSISHNGTSMPVRINRSLVLAGLFEAFDSSKHSSKHYQRLQGVRE